MRKLYLFLCMALSAMTMSATVHAPTSAILPESTDIFTVGQTGEVNTVQTFNARISPEMAERTAAALRTADKLYKLTITFDGEQEYPSFAVFNENFYFQSLNWEEQKDTKTYTFEVPAGTYEIIVRFFSLQFESFATVIREQVEITADVCLTLSESEATEHLIIDPMLKNGQKAILKTINDNDEEDSSKATAQYIGANYFVYREGMEPFRSGSVMSTFHPENDDDSFHFYSNKTSDKYHVSLMTTIQTLDNNMEISVTDVSGISNRNEESYNESFIEYQIPKNAHTPLYDPNEELKISYLITAYLWSDNVQRGGKGIGFSASPKIYVAQQPEIANQKDLKIAVQSTFYDIYKVIEVEKDGRIRKQTISAPIANLPAIYEGGKWNFINNGHSECGNYAFQVPEIGEVLEYPGHPRFSFSTEEINDAIANSAPILTTHQEIYKYEDNIENRLDRLVEPQAFIGRYGEVRRCDMTTLSTIVTLDGEKVFDSAEGERIRDWSKKHCTEEPKGVIDMYTENRNVLVDGEIEGYNIARLHYDENAGDMIAPTPQMLMFRNTRDEITDRFDKAEDGVLEMACADFVWHFNLEPEEGYNDAYYTAQPCDVKVEAAAYQTDNFKEITVEEVPEEFFMPGFGYFYRGSLAGVEANSANGWYDLRITLTDAAGNYLTQTLSPAFAITRGDAIDAITTNVPAATTEYYTLQGIRVTNPAPGQLLIRKQGATATKIRF